LIHRIPGQPAPSRLRNKARSACRRRSGPVHANPRLSWQQPRRRWAPL